MSRESGSARLAIVVSMAVAAAVAVAIVLIDPSRQRLLSLDERRLEDLMRISRQVDIYWKRHQTLPSDLDRLRQEPGFGAPSLDPETGARYDYETKDSDTYRLCARFALDSGDDSDRVDGRSASEWAHPAGRFCFDLEVEKPDPGMN